MKLQLTFIFIVLSLFAYPQYYTSTYQSNYYEEYIYDTLQNDFVLSESFCDNVEVQIDTVYNTFLFIQQVDSNIYLKREFTINNFDFNEEEKLYYFFVEEAKLPKEFSRPHIIYFSTLDSLITIVLENRYSICYFLNIKKH